MKAAYRREREILIKEMPSVSPGPGQIRVVVDACGICGTDLHDNSQDVAKDMTFGHEVAGRIVELGAGVDTLELGQKIVLDSSTPCGRCASCRNAKQELCSNVQSFFSIGSLGLAEEITAPAISAFQYSDLTPAEACLQEPLGVAIDMMRLTEIGVGSNVLVIGPGTIGLMATALARAAGARRVFVAGRGWRTSRAECARTFGADEFIAVDASPLHEHTFGCSIDRILVTAPPVALTDAFRVAGNGAIVTFIGIAHGDAANCTFNANEFHFKKLQLRASFASPALFGPLAIQYLKERVVDPTPLITHRFGLDDAAKAMDVARSDPTSIKVVVEPCSSERQ